MKILISIGYICLLTVSLFGKLVAQSTGQVSNQATGPDNRQGEIIIRSWTDRTALFPGDSVTYHLEIQAESNIDILQDDLAGDELVLTGLELVSSTLKRESGETGINYHASYELISYETERSELSIDALRVRYYYRRSGQRIEDVATIGEVVAPFTSLVMRSTLPADPAQLKLRDLVPAKITSSWLDFAGSLGLLLIILSIAPVALLVAGRQGLVKADEGGGVDVVLKESDTELALIDNLEASDLRQRKQGFDQLEKLLKAYIEKMAGLSAVAMTPAELIQKLSGAETVFNVEDLAAVLEDCERARYGREANLPDENRFKHGILFARNLFAHQ